MADQKENQAWKAFDTSTEAGRLLRQLYGSKPPPVNVPLPRKSKKKPETRDQWRPVSNRAGQVDPRKSTRSIDKERSIIVPRSARQGPKYSQIDFVPRRKNEGAIRQELDDAKMRMDHYRPPHVRNMAAEKDRLSEICAFKGGKILPDEMTAVPVEVLPSEALARRKEQERIARVRRRRAGLPEEESRPVVPKKSEKELLTDTIVAEIEDRQEHLNYMRSMGQRAADEKRVAAEIIQRVKELRRLDPALAREFGDDPEADARRQKSANILAQD